MLSFCLTRKNFCDIIVIENRKGVDVMRKNVIVKVGDRVKLSNKYDARNGATGEVMEVFPKYNSAILLTPEYKAITCDIRDLIRI